MVKNQERMMLNLEQIRLYNKDVFDLLSEIPDSSVDLILTDPPYGLFSEGRPLDKDRFRDGEDVLSWDVKPDFDKLLKEYSRVLRINGRALIFSDWAMMVDIISECGSDSLSYNYPLIWRKSKFTNILGIGKSPANYVEYVNVLQNRNDMYVWNAHKQYAKDVHDFIGKKTSWIKKDLGNRKAEHFFEYNGSQFAGVTETVYQQLIDVYDIDKMDKFLSWDEYMELKTKTKVKPKTTYNILSGRSYNSNVLDYKHDTHIKGNINPYKKIHPTQKPVKLLEDLIEIYSNPGDLVLDTYMGSGSTAEACVRTNRRFIGTDLDENYYKLVKERVDWVQTTLDDHLNKNKEEI